MKQPIRYVLEGSRHWTSQFVRDAGSDLEIDTSAGFDDPAYTSRQEHLDSIYGSRDTVNPCSHYMRSVDLPHTTFVYYLADNNGTDQTDYGHIACSSSSFRHPSSYFGPIDYPIGGVGLESGPVLVDLVRPDSEGFLYVLEPSSLKSLLAGSYKALFPAIEPKLSIPNALFELKDLLSLRHTMKRAIALQHFIRKDKLPKKKKVLSLIRVLADIYLQKRFNADAILTDLIGYFKSLWTWQQELKALLDREGVRQTRHYSVDLDTYADSVHTHQTKPNSVYTGDVRTVRSTNYLTRTFVVTIRYSYWIPEMERQYLALRARLDSLGVNLNPQIVWNAIPWTFVVDWFVDFGQWLGQFKLRNIEPTCLIHDLCWSLTVVRDIKLQKQFGYGAPFGVSAQVTSSAIRENAYIRRPHRFVDLAADIKTAGLDFNKFKLASALILSRNRKRITGGRG